MIVTGIAAVTKSRSKVFLDGEFAFVLYKGELRRFHLREGEEISPKAYEEIMQEVLPKRAKLRAMNLLTKKDYTTAKLREKLKEGGYPESIIQDALDYVASFHYVDDLRYAMDFIECHRENKTRRRIEQDLSTRGIDRGVIEQAFAAWEQDGNAIDEAEMIRQLFRKRGFDAENASLSERRKEYAFLLRKGFSAERAGAAVFGGITEEFS
ncbi:MAG: regulatory protein RecX [Lachnospiraceae bacterium]|nr:regulatory protein RecX [Lachnospiraceae bacterium]